MLKKALNAMTALHSRPGTIKRLGTPDIFSPCRLTPSNYFRFLRGPEYTTVKGVEFVIPLDSLTGQFGQLLQFDKIPNAGSFKIKFGVNTTDPLSFDATAADIQVELRKFAPLVNAVVTGSFLPGFRIIFVGFKEKPELGQVVDSTLEETGEIVTGSWTNITTPWAEPIKKGDRILDGQRLWTVDEVIEMHDLGAQVMAYRVRCD